MPPRLDLAKVLAGAFLVPWWRRAALARVLAVPVALIFAYTLLWQEYAAPRLGAVGGWLGAGLYGLLFTLFAVRCHRVVLLDAESAAPEWRPRWRLRETRFFMWVAGFWLIGFMAFLVLLTVAVNLWQWIARLDGTQLQWAEKAVWAVLFYPFGRLSPMFPATAVEHQPLPRIRWAPGSSRAATAGGCSSWSRCCRGFSRCSSGRSTAKARPPSSGFSSACCSWRCWSSRSPPCRCPTAS